MVLADYRVCVIYECAEKVPIVPGLTKPCIFKAISFYQESGNSVTALGPSIYLS